MKLDPRPGTQTSSIEFSLTMRLQGLDPVVGSGGQDPRAQKCGGSASRQTRRGSVSSAAASRLRARIRASQGGAIDFAACPFNNRKPMTRDGIGLNSGALLVREWRGKLERVMVLDKGFAWNGRTFGSLSQVARAITGASRTVTAFSACDQRRIRVRKQV